MRNEPKTLKQFVQYLKYRQSEDYDILLPIHGSEGDGKSHTAMVLGYILDRTFTWDRHEFNGPTYWHQMESLPNQACGVWDEMTKGGLRVRTMASDNVDALRHIIQDRHHLHAHLFCIPDPELALKYISAKRAPWRIWCNREPGWKNSILEVEQAIRKYNRYRDDWHVWWKTAFRRRFPPVLIDTPPWQRYLKKKEDWTRRHGRDTDKALQERTTSEDREQIDKLKNLLKRPLGDLRSYWIDWAEKKLHNGTNNLDDPEKHIRPHVEKMLENPNPRPEASPKDDD